jgi:hypothetical protein
LETATLGFRAHSGWAAVVAIGGTPAAPRALDRRRIVLTGARLPKQPYHAAEPLALSRARELLDRCEEDSRRLAGEELRNVADFLRAQGLRVRAAALLLAANRPLPDLAGILASHALIHAADGEHFREAVRRAARELEIPLLEVREKDLLARASATLRLAPEEVTRRAAEIGKALGPPWTQDQKLAAVAAWLALADPPGASR